MVTTEFRWIYGQQQCSQVGTIIEGNRKIVIYIIIGRDHSGQERKVIESNDGSIYPPVDRQLDL
jgi:hypothetical protein